MLSIIVQDPKQGYGAQWVYPSANGKLFQNHPSVKRNRLKFDNF